MSHPSACSSPILESRTKPSCASTYWTSNRAGALRFKQRYCFQVYPYPCIRCFLFATLRMKENPYYATMLDIVKTSKEPLKFLDLGCCFGTDIRQLIFDGYPAEDITGIELRPEFIQLGHELFKDTPATFPSTIIIGDILDPAQLSPTTTNPPAPLDHLKGQFDFIYIGCILHLFDEDLKL
ncbi:hypothetical protein BC937DRAFT_90872 [Endogone sp. FLAS-F59071]|nr:hypothetical protein BC937DRAFT_90872 [Endogone sp. FLAS-F59071]|eukprot:RUS16719.1 hypothetical protein BC937DRAFT_90872 [Endogone sp. FLAS-F59071]